MDSLGIRLLSRREQLLMYYFQIWNQVSRPMSICSKKFYQNQ